MKTLIILFIISLTSQTQAAQLLGCFKYFVKLKNNKVTKNTKYPLKAKGFLGSKKETNTEVNKTVGAAIATMQLSEMIKNPDKIETDKRFNYDVSSSDLAHLLSMQNAINKNIDDFNEKNNTSYYPFTTLDTMNYLYLRLKYRKKPACTKPNKNSFLLFRHLSDIEIEYYLQRYASRPETTETKEYNRGCLSKIIEEKLNKEQLKSFKTINAAYAYKDFLKFRENKKAKNLPPEIVDLKKMHDEMLKLVAKKAKQRGKRFKKIKFYEFARIIRFLNENNPTNPICKKRFLSKKRYTIYPMFKLKKKIANYLVKNLDEVFSEIETVEKEFTDHQGDETSSMDI
jgi:hypothetical protein